MAGESLAGSQPFLSIQAMTRQMLNIRGQAWIYAVFKIIMSDNPEQSYGSR